MALMTVKIYYWFLSLMELIQRIEYLLLQESIILCTVVYVYVYVYVYFYVYVYVYYVYVYVYVYLCMCLFFYWF